MGRKRTHTEQAKASSSAAPSYDTERFINEDAANAYQKWQERSVVPERGMIIEPPVLDYVEKFGWHQFCEDPTPFGCAEMTREFYANYYAGGSMHKAKVRGISVRLSARTINDIYGLRNVDQEPFKKLLRSETDASDEDDDFDMRLLMQTLTGRYEFPPPGWKFLKKADLVPEAKVWLHFVAARIMPTIPSSEVARKRAMLIYALMTGLPVDVGTIINEEMHFALRSAAGRHAFGFPCTIARLCARAGLEFEPLQLVVKKSKISLDLIPGHRARLERPEPSQARQRQPERNEIRQSPPLLVDPSRPNDASAPSTADRLARIEEQLNDMLNGQREIKDQLNDVQIDQRRMEERFDGLYAMMQQLLDRSPPPT